MARLKQAKEEANREIAEFRAQIEAEFQRKLAEVSVICQGSLIAIRLIFSFIMIYFQFLENLFSLFVLYFINS